MQRLGRLFWYLLFSSNEFSAWKMRSIFSCQDHFGWGDWHSALTDKQWFDQLYLLHHLTKSGRCNAYANVAIRRRGLYCWCEVVTLLFRWNNKLVTICHFYKKKTLNTQTKTHLEFSFFLILSSIFYELENTGHTILVLIFTEVGMKLWAKQSSLQWETTWVTLEMTAEPDEIVFPFGKLNCYQVDMISSC